MSTMSSDESFASFNSSLSGGDEHRASPLSAFLKSEGGDVCYGCSLPIIDRYLLMVNNAPWHVHCLRCSVCQVGLDRHTSCYIRDDSIYCKQDYTRQFGAHCSKCSRHIQATDWVRRAKDHVYHLACFSCDSCKRQLSTGEEFALMESRVLCKTHYIEVIEGGANSDSDSSNQKPKTKRVRTTFTEEQIQVLQANFQLDSNPDGQDLERIAQITGLSKRVTQVWFQNSRARQKKHQQQHQQKHNIINNMNSINNNLNNSMGSPPALTSSPTDSCNGSSWASALGSTADMSFSS